MSITFPSFHVLFSELEKDALMNFRTNRAIRSSVIYTVMKPLWEAIASTIPASVSPNLLTCISVILSLQGYAMVSQHWDDDRTIAFFLAIICLVGAQLISAVDGIHARNTRSRTVMGLIVSHACGGLRPIFLVLTLCKVYEIDSPASQWYLVQTVQLINLIDCIIRMNWESERKNSLPQASYLISNSELMAGTIMLVVLKVFFPWIHDSFSEHFLWSEYNCRAIYGLAVAGTLLCIFFVTPKHNVRRSRVPMTLALAIRVVPAVILRLRRPSNDAEILADGLMIGIIALEEVVSACSGRTFPYYIVAMCLLSIQFSTVTIVLSICYTVCMLGELSSYTHLPILLPLRNVYIDGVYDLCHKGHKNVMKYASQFGNRLIVGVMSDEACVDYKRKPVMTTEERIEEVKMCKFVSEVVPNAPCDGLTEEFLNEHNIHVVVYGEEYDKPNDKYYAVARKLGIGVTAPRTTGISTSEIIRRIREADEARLVAKDKIRIAEGAQ